MKIIAIGDLHGKSTWKEVKIEEYDKVIFLGDYLDAWTGSDQDMLSNLEEIIVLKKGNPEKVELLLGNHDIQYLFYPEFRCSGFRPSGKLLFTEVLQKNRNLFKVAYQHTYVYNTGKTDEYLFTHAGISDVWYSQHKELLEEYGRGRQFEEELAPILNDILQTKDYPILCEIGRSRGGWSNSGGPFWADKSETQKFPLPNFHQVVGHSKVKEITWVGNEHTSVIYCDVLDTMTQFYELTI